MFFFGMLLVWADATVSNQKGPGWLFLAGMLIIITGWIHSGSKSERAGIRFEARHTFLTLYRRGEVFAHEDMRLITSLLPTTLKNGKATSYTATFENGTTMAIFYDLENFDKLIAKLNGYLDANRLT